MKRNDNYILDRVAGADFLFPLKGKDMNFDRIISLNELGVFIWNLLEHDMTDAEIVDAVVAEYEVSSETAARDVAAFLQSLNQYGCLS